MNVLQVFFTGFTPPSDVIYFCKYLKCSSRPFQVALEGGKISKDSWNVAKSLNVLASLKKLLNVLGRS